jgi:hypothetical protein
MEAFFGIDGGEGGRGKTYYLPFLAEEAVDGVTVRSPALVVWKEGAAEARVDKMLGRKLMEGIERKFGYEGDWPTGDFEWPEWYWPRLLSRVSGDGGAVVLSQERLWEGDGHGPLGGKSVFLCGAVHEARERDVGYIDRDCRGYAGRVKNSRSHYDVEGGTALEAPPALEAPFALRGGDLRFSADLSLVAQANYGSIRVFETATGRSVYSVKFPDKPNGTGGYATYVLEVSAERMIYVLGKSAGKWDAAYYDVDLENGELRNVYRERFDTALAYPYSWDGPNPRGRYYAKLEGGALKIFDRVTGGETEIRCDEFPRADFFSRELLTLDEEFVKAYVDVGPDF